MMDYRKSPWVRPGDPNYGKMVCQDKKTIVDGFFASDESFVYRRCLANCKRCVNDFTCSECGNPNDDGHQYYVVDGTLPHRCEKCKAEESKFYENGKCQDCPAECVRCSSPTSSSECKPDHFILDRSRSGICEPCPQRGFREEAGRCLRICTENQYRTDDNRCLPCPDSRCLKCKDVTGDCIECVKDYKRREDDGKCWIQCGRGKFNQDKDTCRKCPENCLECSRSQGTCTLCRTGLTLTESKDCWKLCQLKEYNETPTTCSRCPENCQECENLTGNCQKCESGLITNEEKNSCEKVIQLILEKTYFSALEERPRHVCGRA